MSLAPCSGTPSISETSVVNEPSRRSFCTREGLPPGPAWQPVLPDGTHWAPSLHT